ncbi:hypothetical protein [Vibrio sonorensis]|uniref:hypothetical protein n=1 Tax=Vibrio sonorensis TaxID=1004316 RepID=UPI0008D9365A|nr:hypothetical protein [Vibrio sonorensis]
MLSVRRAAVKGMSILELLIAQSISLVGMSSMLSLFYFMQTFASESASKRLLVSELSSLTQLMENTLNYSGYNGSRYYAVPFSQHANLIGAVNDGVTGVGSIAWVEQGSYYQHTFYVNNGRGQLKICEKRSTAPLTVEQATTSGYLGVCFNLFNSKQIYVDSLDVTEFTTDGGGIWIVSISAYLTKLPDHKHQSAFLLLESNQ